MTLERQAKFANGLLVIASVVLAAIPGSGQKIATMKLHLYPVHELYHAMDLDAVAEISPATDKPTRSFRKHFSAAVSVQP